MDQGDGDVKGTHAEEHGVAEGAEACVIPQEIVVTAYQGKHDESRSACSMVFLDDKGHQDPQCEKDCDNQLGCLF